MACEVSLFDNVIAINKFLEDQGAFIVQKVLMPGNRVLYGYLPQAVFDAVNSVLKPEGWHYIVLETTVYDNEVVARVAVKIGNKECVQYGGMKIIKGDHGSAHKGAVTDALQKALSMFGVGSLAYRGQLKAVFEGGEGAGTDDRSVSAMPEIEKEIKALTDRKVALKWWKDNVDMIQALPKPDMERIVRLLGEKK
jgi:electron transfer flavoprotein alpha subunit